jgi:hypothetical protein
VPPQLVEGVAPGDTVEVKYAESGSTAIALVVAVTATPSPSTGDGS